MVLVLGGAQNEFTSAVSAVPIYGARPVYRDDVLVISSKAP